jgi:hypothetical protein
VDIGATPMLLLGREQDAAAGTQWSSGRRSGGVRSLRCRGGFAIAATAVRSARAGLAGGAGAVTVGVGCRGLGRAGETCRLTGGGTGETSKLWHNSFFSGKPILWAEPLPLI